MKQITSITFTKLLQKIPEKKSAILALVIVAIAGITGGITTKHALIAATPEPEIPLAIQNQIPFAASSTMNALSTASAPITLLIPTLDISTHIQYTGISIHNTLAVPTNYSDVGWFRYGPLPGQVGNAIIDGHRDNGFGLAAVFKRLNELHVDDSIFIITNSGQKLKFEVKSIKIVPENSLIDYLFDATSTSQLTLITCDGTWQSEKNMYSDRLIVTTTYMGTE